MFIKIYNSTKIFLIKAGPVLFTVVAIITIIDFVLKWQIYPYVFNILSILFKTLYKFAFESFVLVCLPTLFGVTWNLRKKIISSKPNALEKQILDIKTSLEIQMKKNSDSYTAQAKSIESRLNEKILEIEYTLVDFEIENHRAKNQVGEVSMMIKKLNMDIKRKWGAEDTLLEIKEYIKKSGMPSYFLEDLTTALKGTPESLKIIAGDILKLAQEKLYNPR